MSNDELWFTELRSQEIRIITIKFEMKSNALFIFNFIDLSLDLVMSFERV